MQVDLWVLQWSGFGKGYASQENIPDPILLVKYNALVRRSTFLRTAKVTPPPTLCCGMMSVQQLYATSLEFLHEALKLLTTKCSPYVKPQLEPGLQEQKFTIELLTAISQKDKFVVEECVFDLLSKRSLSTIGQLAVCQHSSSSWQTKHRFTTRKARLVRGGTRGEEPEGRKGIPIPLPLYILTRGRSQNLQEKVIQWLQHLF